MYLSKLHDSLGLSKDICCDDSEGHSFGERKKDSSSSPFFLSLLKSKEKETGLNESRLPQTVSHTKTDDSSQADRRRDTFDTKKVSNRVC